MVVPSSDETLEMNLARRRRERERERDSEAFFVSNSVTDHRKCLSKCVTVGNSLKFQGYYGHFRCMFIQKKTDTSSFWYFEKKEINESC